MKNSVSSYLLNIGSIILKKYAILVIFIIIFTIASFSSPNFLTVTNIINVIRQVSVIGIIACGETLVLISGMVDLSPGSVIALAGVIAVDVMARTNSIFLAVLTGMVIGCLTGFINGFLIGRFSLPSFIVTLAMMTGARGLIYIITNAIPLGNLGKLVFLGQGYIGPIPFPIIMLLTVAVVATVILKFTKFGRHIYAIGGNETVTMAAGINVKKLKIYIFMVHGILVGFAGVILMARLGSGQPAAGLYYEFDAITAVIIGGTSLYGGMGNIYGTLAGALIIGIIINIFNLLNISGFWQMFLKGVIILIAVLLDLQTKKSIKRI